MKKRIQMCTAGICLLCAVISTVIIVKSTSEARQYTEQMELGERYLAELEYESAVVAYMAAIEIEPKNAEAYIGLAEAYLGMGETDKAIEILEEGIRQTDSEELKSMLDKIQQELAEAEKKRIEAEKAKLAEAEKETTTMPEPTEPEFVDHVMDWQDENLEKAMREITGITDRDIMLSDVWNMTELFLKERGIQNVDALGELVNVRYLGLQNNNINNIDALANLKRLKHLYLDNNDISDISELSNLTNLDRLDLNGNNISDINPLSNLKKNTEFGLG